jgi:hypothetical protein
VEAIYYAEDVPDEWADYVRANAEFFEADFREDVGRDHPVVTAAPVRVL